jgi:hypothetical protein
MKPDQSKKKKVDGNNIDNSNSTNTLIVIMTPLILAGAEPETIDRGCPVQINRMFGSKENLFFTVRPLFFSEPRGCPGAGWRLPWFHH